MAHYLALTCEALARSTYAISAQTDHTITVQIYRQGLHNRPKNLRAVLQEQIDVALTQPVDAILLIYGLCGASTVGLTARQIPLVIPRVHDCISLYLGSRERYQAEFDRHPGTYWYSVDYMERAESGASAALGAVGIETTNADYEKYVQKYGQATADMLLEEMRQWSQHYTRAAFIDTGLGNPEHFLARAREKAAKEGWVFERIQGNRRLLEMLINGNWPEAEFLLVPPGYTIRQQYDDGLMKAVREED
jgi:hypothetical protein